MCSIDSITHSADKITPHIAHTIADIVNIIGITSARLIFLIIKVYGIDAEESVSSRIANRSRILFLAPSGVSSNWRSSEK